MGKATIGGAAGIITGGAVVTGLWMLFERNERPALEAKSYVRSIHEAAENWAANTERLTESLGRLRTAATPLPDLVDAYVAARGRR